MTQRGGWTGAITAWTCSIPASGVASSVRFTAGWFETPARATLPTR